MPININHAQNKLTTDTNNLTIDVSNNLSLAGTAQVKNALDPTDPQDLATKAYVDSISGSGGNLTLGTPVDGTFGDGAFLQFQPSQTITDAIDDLNEVIENVRNNTFVKDVDFTANNTVGGAGLNVTLNITTVGNANRYTIDWGDGSTTTATSDSTPSHTYTSNIGSPFDVSVEAFNNSGNGSGSTATKLREDYIIIYTATPVVSFSAYASPTGGSPITQWDDGDTIYFENTTTNTNGANVEYIWTWGDSSPDTTVTLDSALGGVGGGRLSHTFTASNEQEQTRQVTLTLNSHSTATPGTTPTDDDNSYKIYDDHTPEVALNLTTGINEESSNGLTVTFTNNTETTVGSYSTYGQRYLYTFGDGSTQYVNAGSNQSGDHGRTITHRYSLTASEQANGTSRDYTGNLQLITDHSNSPFITSDFTVHLEPDVRAIISGTAVNTSDRSGDDIHDVYKGVDYNGNNRALYRLTNTSQNADSFSYTWPVGVSFANFPNALGMDGYVGTPLELDWTNEPVGTYNLTFTASGTPDITAQTDTDNSINVQVHDVPTMPGSNHLSNKTLSLSDSYQGSSPKLASGFTDNSSTNPLNAGDSLMTSTARRYSSGTIDTNVVQNAYAGETGIVTAYINGVASGNKSFTSTLNENGTFNKLIISDNRDANDTLSGSTFPTGFYQTFDSKITGSLSSTYSIGVNDQKIEHSITGSTNHVAVVYDSLNSTPTIDLTSATLTESNAGTYRYISGIPYYNTGSPQLTLSGLKISNLVGQAYRDTSNVLEIAPGTNYESTSSSTINTQYKSYSDIDNPGNTFLSGGIPIVDTGVGSAYTIDDQTIAIKSTSGIGVETIKFRAYNVNGTGNYAELSGPKIQLHTSNPSGFSDTIIPVSSSLGNGTFTNNGLRIADFLSDTTDTPTFTGSTNYYTNNVWAGNEVVSGTQEATVRFGVLKHDTTDYSTGFLPVGPDRSSDNGRQYFTFAFQRQVVANFDISINGTVAGVWIAAPGTTIDNSSSLNGWLDATSQYLGVGVPGANTGSGGNGGNGCALTGADVIPTNSYLNSSYTLTLGSENMSNSTGNVVLVRVGVDGFQSLNSISIGVAS